MRYLFLILILNPIQAFSANIIGKITCSSQVRYAYINGILNKTEREAKNSARLIEEKILKNDQVEVIFNQSGGVIKDLVDALGQKIEESARNNWGVAVFGSVLIATKNKGIPDNRKVVMNRFKELSKDGEKLIIFSHSQGNLYANNACEELKKVGKEFINIQIASPANEILCGKKSHYTTMSSDEMYIALKWVIDPKKSSMDLSGISAKDQEVLENFKSFKDGGILLSPLKANIQQARRKASSFFDFEHHSINNYMRSPASLNNIKKHHSEILKSLKGNQILTKRPMNIHCGNVDNWVGQSLIEPNDINGKPYKADFFSGIFTSYEVRSVGEKLPEGYSPQYNSYVLTESFSLLKLFTIMPIALLFSIPILLLIFRGSKETLDNMETYEEEQERLRRERGY